MKMKSMLIRAVTVLSLGFLIAPISAMAGSNSYYPPERIHCKAPNGKLVCEGFNRQYLLENTTTADFDGSKEQNFSFVSGVAYFNSDRSEVTVFYTFNNVKNKNVMLRTASTDIRPDFENGNWVKTAEDIYQCNAGYMQCPITSLPSDGKH